MKALHIIRPGEVGITEIDKPLLERGEVLIKLKYVGFCGSDLNTFLGKNPMVRLPVVPGHEISGEIAGVGQDVPDIYKAGMACTVNPYTSCGFCSSCRNGRPNACRFNQTMGVQRDGGMCEYLVVPWQKVIADAELSAEELALVEPLSVGFHAVSRGEVTDTDTVLVIGCGMIGIGAIIRSLLRGAKVIVLDVDDTKLALAKRLGVSHVVNSTTENVEERLQEYTGGNGADVVIEAVGLPATYQMAVREVAFTGRVVCIGYAKSETAFETKYFVMKELDIRGSRNAMPEDFRAVAGYLKHHTDLELASELVTAVYPPERAQEALERWRDSPGEVFRILIDFQ